MSATMFRMAADAYRAGQTQAVGRGPRVNPYDGTSSSPIDRVMSVMWARGFTRGNPMPDEGGALPSPVPRPRG